MSQTKKVGNKMKEYYWTVESSGIIEAESLDDAKEYLEENSHALVSDDYKYWSLKVDADDDKGERYRRGLGEIITAIDNEDVLSGVPLSLLLADINRIARSALDGEPTTADEFNDKQQKD